MKRKLKFAKSDHRYRVAFLMVLVLEKEMKVIILDKAVIDYYIRFTNFRHQLQTIGYNYDQTVQAVKANFDDTQASAIITTLEKATLELACRTGE